jgi:hypothetical protein
MYVEYMKSGCKFIWNKGGNLCENSVFGDTTGVPSNRTLIGTEAKPDFGFL